MPRRTTAFNMGTRSNYDYQFTGYQGAANPFAQLAQVFNSGTRAEQSSTLQARHALIMGTVGNTLDLQRQQGMSDIDFADARRRSKSNAKTIRKQQNWLEENHPDKGIVVTGVNRHGDISQTPTVSHALQQQHSAYSFLNQNPPTSGSGGSTPPSPSNGGGSTTTGGWNPQDSSLFSDTGGASQHPFLNTNQFTPSTAGKESSGESEGTGSGSKTPDYDANTGRPKESEEGDSTIEPQATHVSDFTETGGGSGTADLAEAHGGTATSTVGSHTGSAGYVPPPRTHALPESENPIPPSTNPIPAGSSPLPTSTSPLPEGSNPLYTKEDAAKGRKGRKARTVTSDDAGSGTTGTGAN